MIERREYRGWPNCIRLANRHLELIATTDVGPRVIHVGPIGGPNLFHVAPDTAGMTGGTEWRSYGGHRLWHAPEVMPRTYAPDNEPIRHDWDGRSLTLAMTERDTGLEKEITVAVADSEPAVEVTHRLVNRGPWPVELAPWALSVMAPGGVFVLPHEEYRPHPEVLTPARPLVLWHYTDMADPRWTWGARVVALRQDPAATTKQKIGALNSRGWAAYVNAGIAFVKRYAAVPGARYPDMGANTEAFTDAEMLEFETLGPLTVLEPGAHVDHAERWFVARLSGEPDVDGMADQLTQLIERTDRGAA